MPVWVPVPDGPSTNALYESPEGTLWGGRQNGEVWRLQGSGTNASVVTVDRSLTVYADDEFKLGQVMDVMRTRLAKRNVDVRALASGAIEKISGDKVKRPVSVKVGVSQDKAKQIQSLKVDAGGMRHAIDIANGMISRPVNVTAAKISSDIRAVQSMAKLGGAVISSMTRRCWRFGALRIV